jgi:hypothetical protein
VGRISESSLASKDGVLMLRVCRPVANQENRKGKCAKKGNSIR